MNPGHQKTCISRAAINAIMLAIPIALCGACSDEGPTATPITPDAITCGTQSCALATSPGCCDTASPSCTNAACSAAALYKCDGPEDCGGNACCGSSAGGSTCAQSSACETSELIYCHRAQDCPSSFPQCVAQDNMHPGGIAGAVIAVCRN